MPDIHIVRMLEERAYRSLSDAEIASAESHTAICGECKTALDAARIAAVLIEVRASENIEAGPFFKTRVMASIRERRLAVEEPVLARLWKTAGALVSTMAVLLLILTGITIFSQNGAVQMPQVTVAGYQNIYSPEYVVLERGDLFDDELANDQVIGTIYDLEDGDGQ